MAHLVELRERQNLLQENLIPEPLPLARVPGGALDRERAVNNALFAQMLEFVFQMGADAGGSNGATRQLIFENRQLRQHIIQRTEALEKEWLGKAEYFSAKVDVIYFKFNQLHQGLKAENEEAKKTGKLELSYVAANGKDWNWPAFERDFGGDFSSFGAASATLRVYGEYSYYIPSHVKAWEKFHLQCRDLLKTAIQIEIKRIQDEMLPEILVVEPPPVQQMPAFDVNAIGMADVGAVFNAFTQMRQLETQTLDERNDAIREKNEGLSAKKRELENMEHSLFGVLRRQLSYQVGASKTDIEVAKSELAREVREYPKLLKELGHQPKSRRTGHYKKGIELEKKISLSLNEIAVLTEAFRKELNP